MKKSSIVRNAMVLALFAFVATLPMPCFAQAAPADKAKTEVAAPKADDTTTTATKKTTKKKRTRKHKKAAKKAATPTATPTPAAK